MIAPSLVLRAGIFVAVHAGLLLGIMMLLRARFGRACKSDRVDRHPSWAVVANR